MLTENFCFFLFRQPFYTNGVIYVFVRMRFLRVFMPPLNILGVFLHCDTLCVLSKWRWHCSLLASTLRLGDDGGSMQRAGESYSDTPSSPLRVRVVFQTPGASCTKSTNAQKKHLYASFDVAGLCWFKIEIQNFLFIYLFIQSFIHLSIHPSKPKDVFMCFVSQNKSIFQLNQVVIDSDLQLL